MRSGNWKSIRVLVADDHESWRHLVASMFRMRPELEIMSEVSDGLEAVRKAQELQPDLIVMNIGVPRLHELEIHGLEAARRIRMLSPRSKIIFASQQMSTDVVQEAFARGHQDTW